MTATVAAVDLGATSGRVMLGAVGANELDVRQVARFPNIPVRTIDGLHWNILDLYRNVVDGLAAALRKDAAIAGIGVDAWAVDYALLRGNRMLGAPFHYRDDRTAPAIDAVHARVPPQELYAANGLQFLSFNTLYQFTADRADGILDSADAFLLVPDLLTYWLTGERIAERTNASTTGLLNVTSRQWDDELIARLELPRRTFPTLMNAGERVGTLLSDVAEEVAAPAHLEVTTVGSHDTASAVVGVPMPDGNSAYISCGTWGLVGVELERPVLSEAGRLANFTNEGGVDGRVRYLHNVMGLWLLNESVRTWEREGPVDTAELLVQAEAVTGPVTIFDANDSRFMAPGDIPARIADYCREHDLPVPGSRVELVRSIIESLADAFAHAVEKARELSGATVETVHIVGGGSQNELLCQLTADRVGLPVLAGPVEATAIGNVLVQARTHGFVTGSLESLRALIAAAYPPRTYRPRPGTG